MPKQVMDRSASDNEYLHRDFHGALSSALIYLEERFGPDAVRDYLARFARRFYAPLRHELQQRGLPAMAEHLRRVYEREGAEISIDLSNDEMIVRIEACPAVTHMRQHEYEVSPLWYETVRTVHQAVCEGSPFTFELVNYDLETGASTGRFSHHRSASGEEEEELR